MHVKLTVAPAWCVDNLERGAGAPLLLQQIEHSASSKADGETQRMCRT